MAINKPYYRIFRPQLENKKKTPEFYFEDERYAVDRSMLCRSYKILENDLKTIFEYIEPCDDNLKTYSHRLYAVLLRACTEFETNCKRILEANGYQLPRYPKMVDYKKINRATKLSEYEAVLNYWSYSVKVLKPFSSWNSADSLTWYSSYNNVKHDRQNKFKEASLINLINSVAGVLIILCAQFDFLTLIPYQPSPVYFLTEDGGATIGESLFEIRYPQWSESEKYDFDWDVLKHSSVPFEKFTF